MEIIASQLPLFACLASLLAVIPILLFRKTPNLREAATIGAGALKLAIVLTMLPGILGGKVYEFTFFEAVKGIPLAFRVDGIGMLFALVASSLWILTSFYAIGYMRGAKEAGQTRFFCFFAISLSATLGVAFAANLFTLYVFYEMLSLATYPLVTHHQDKEARSGGRTYLTYLLSTSIGFALPAMLFCYFKSGESLTFTETSNWAAALSGPTVLVLLLLFVFGFAKAGVMPFHSWLPNAMVAPTPVSALLHAVAVVKVGVFSIIRVFTGVFGTDFLQTLDVSQVISWIAAITVVTSSLIAMTQDNLKRLLAFSTIGQLSYIVLGVSLLTPHAVQGSMLHIPMHAFGKITLFFCAGAIYVASGKKYISQ
ncbi:proton-conducting transporter membrane subunit, partial [Verrucomicrobiales bacterium]|nr:proton-conducting transporter membrane subunit [Verrucomicrobiales bacterium]